MASHASPSSVDVVCAEREPPESRLLSVAGRWAPSATETEQGGVAGEAGPGCVRGAVNGGSSAYVKTGLGREDRFGAEERRGEQEEVVNGFPEPSSSFVDLGGGQEDGRLSPAAAGNMDGMAPPERDLGSSEVGDGTGAGVRVMEQETDPQLDCEQLPPAMACSCKNHRDSVCSQLTKKVPNGDVCMQIPRGCLDLERERMEGFLHRNAALDKGVRLGNCGFLVVNTRSLWDAPPGGPPRLGSPPENARSSPGSCDSPDQESGHASLEASDSTQPQQAASCEPDPGLDTLSELSGKLSISPLAENASDCAEDFSDAGFSARPQTLRTIPGCPVSLSCDATPLSPEDAADFFGDEGGVDGCLSAGSAARRQSAPDKLPEGICVDSDPSSDPKGTKRHGIAEFLTRSLFSWKTKEPKATAAQSAPGWRLFGKTPPKDNPPDSGTIQQECEARAGPGTGPHPRQPMRRKNLEFEPLSTTALILEDRPANLPAKSEEEAQRHRQEYNEMVAGAKRREMKEAQRKKKQMKERYRQEENIAHAMVIWNTEILPNWESMRNTRRVRELWWQGLPPSVRGKVWSLAIGNELNITPELYEIFLSRAKEKWRSFNETSSVSENEDCGASLADRESSLDLIKLDIFRTFPSLYIFQKGGPYHDLLHSVLGAYTCYRPDVGYVQGMSFIAAVLILNLEEADAFIAFANLLNKPCQMAFFRVDHDLMLKYFAAFEVFFEENLPKLFQHFQNNSLTPDFYLIDWIFTLYSKSLPLDVACRVWDLFCRDGEEALFRTGLGILRLYQDVLLQMDFIHSAQFLSRLPENTPAHTLFTCIANTQMLSNNRRWNQVFSALMKDGPKETDKTASPALRS
ncbi:hypothetical protein SRHO_G00128670 [Serrasalmus rhombeus]